MLSIDKFLGRSVFLGGISDQTGLGGPGYGTNQSFEMDTNLRFCVCEWLICKFEWKLTMFFFLMPKREIQLCVHDVAVHVDALLLMEEILHQLISSLSHYLQGFLHPRWCRISAINI